MKFVKTVQGSRRRTAQRVLGPGGFGLGSVVLVALLATPTYGTTILPPYAGSVHRHLDASVAGCATWGRPVHPSWNGTTGAASWWIRTRAFTGNCSWTGGSNDTRVDLNIWLKIPINVTARNVSVAAEWNVSGSATESVRNHGSCSIVVHLQPFTPCWARSQVLFEVGSEIYDATAHRRYGALATIIWYRFDEESNQTYCGVNFYGPFCQYANSTYGAPASATFSSQDSFANVSFTAQTGHQYFLETGIGALVFADARGYPRTVAKASIDLTSASLASVTVT